MDVAIKMIERWARQNQIFNAISELESTTTQNLYNYLKTTDKHITTKVIDSSLRHYKKNGYLKRGTIRPYSYRLTNKGLKQLEWLEDGEHLEYIEMREIING